MPSKVTLEKGSKSSPPGAESRALPLSLSDLDPKDTTILKGLAIIAIVFHNFFHAVSPALQNEFRFHPGGFAVFLEQARHPLLAIQAFFSYFGYLGITIFIFLSAFGLAKKHWDDPSNWTKFMAGRFVKLYPIFGIIVVPWTFVISFQVETQKFLHTIFPQIVLLMLGLSPLVPGQNLPPVGPWWFIPFIIEFYAIFFLLRHVTRRFGWPGLAVLALLGLAVSVLADRWLAGWGINLFETPLGRLPLICLGIAAARYPFRIPAPVLAVAGATFLLGCQFAAVWPLTSLAALLLALPAYMSVRSGLRNSWLLEQIGRYSIVIFLINAIIRNQFLPFATTPILQLLFGAISAVASFLLSAAIYEFLIQRSVVAFAEPKPQ